MADHSVRIYRRVNKAGKARYTASYRAPDGTWVSAGTFGDKQAAQLAGLRGVSKVEEHGWIDTKSGKATLADYAKTVYLPQMPHEASTVYSYTKVFHKHIEQSVIGKMAMNRITTGDVQRFVLAKRAEGFSPAYVRRLYMVVRQILKTAVLDGFLRANPCSGVTLPVLVEPEVKILSPEEFDAFIEKVPVRWRGAVEVAIETGMRAGEIRALSPDQIDFLRRTITVKRAMNFIPEKGFVLKPYPKGRRPRTILVSEGLIEVLAQQAAARGLGPTASSEDSLSNVLFTAVRGGPFNQSLTDAVAEGLAAVGIEGRSLKHLRSSHCSWLLAGGQDPASVQKRMGHTSIMTTQKYIQTLPEAEEKNLAAFARIRNRSNTG